MKLRGIVMAIAVVMGLTLGSSRYAAAHTADAAGIIAELIEVQAAIVGAIQNYMGNILNQSVQQASSQATAESEKLIATIAETARGQEVTRAMGQLQRDAIQVKEAMQLPPFACQTLASSEATAKAEDGAREIVADMSKSLEKRALDTPNTAASASSLFAKIEEMRKKVPVNAKTMLGSKTYTADEREAANLFITAVTDPMPVEKLPDGWEKTPQGRAFAFQQQLYQHRLAIAQQPLIEAVAARTPQPGAGTRAGLATTDASAYEIAISEVEKRVLLPDWKKSIMTKYTDPLPVLKEIALMMGTGLFIDQKSAERLERMEIIMATSLAMKVRESEEPKLRAQREVVTRAMANKQ